MTDWVQLEQLYTPKLERPSFRDFGLSMLRALQHLRGHLDIQKYSVGSAMYNLAIWAREDKSRVVQIFWTEENGFQIFDTHKSHTVKISLENMLETIEELLSAQN
jgi:hypothetical protein